MKELLLAALKDAGQTIREQFGSIQEYTQKENQSSIVTKTDLKAEQNITDKIQETYPDHNILAEESGFVNKNSEYTWIVDPLDGTSNFQAGLPWFGVMICVLKNRQPHIAGIYLPMSDDSYYAQAGQGATKNGNPINVSQEEQLENTLFGYGLDAGDEKKTVSDMKILGGLVRNIRNLRSTNSAIDFCTAADGRTGGFVNQTTKVWDVAAPHLITQEAGGIVTDINGDDLVYELEKPEKNYTYVAASQILHQQIMDIIKKT